MSGLMSRSGGGGGAAVSPGAFWPVRRQSLKPGERFMLFLKRLVPPSGSAATSEDKFIPHWLSYEAKI